ncbi:unnamed protein product [Adineta steineri]|uniref:Uncharacterized protein n=2 Tax=Adineta steineri TaxID=433720 RepID=A0A813SV17_9BILA|nr:unnamed protein product [Adineta steineri]CAF3558772.1 unnamed protein product [Adineta steineri]
MTEDMLNNASVSSSVREKIYKYNMLANTNGKFSSKSIKLRNNAYSVSSINSVSRSTLSDYLSGSNENQHEHNSPNRTSTIINHFQSNIDKRKSSVSLNSHKHDELKETPSISIHATTPIISKELRIPTQNNSDEIGLEIIESETIHDNYRSRSTTIEHYGEDSIQQQTTDISLITPSPQSRLPPPLPPLPLSGRSFSNLESTIPIKRSFPLSNLLLETGALVVVFILCMVLVLAIKENQANLRTTMQIVYTYIYLISIIWMIWCALDIIKFRRHWIKLTATAHDHEEYMDMVEHNSLHLAYFPDIHNTGGLFMRIGAGLLCMGGLILTIIELAKTIETVRIDQAHHRASVANYSKSVSIARSIMFIFRFIFHCIQFTFLFRYGNLIIDRYHFIARVGLIHIVIANFCTWFEAIVIETLEQIHKQSDHIRLKSVPQTLGTINFTSVDTTNLTFGRVNIFKNILAAAPTEEDHSHNSTTTVLEFIENVESLMGSYLYPCLIEYSLICVTVFYIMWRNVGKTQNRSFLHFADRHIFSINCSRASYGLVFGGILFLLTILALIPAYIVETSTAIPITHITEFVLLIVSSLIVCISFIYTTKLYYDRQAHVDTFDRILILITTIGDFAYSCFGLFASIFVQTYTIPVPRFIEILIHLLSIFQTFFQSAFILDALKRRIITKSEFRKKPGRELITALLLINLAIWLHDSLSAKKVQLNPLQTDYYDATTWSIVQAFTSPLSIFYRFHSSVCLADIWQEVYHNHGNHRLDRSINTSNNNNQH